MKRAKKPARRYAVFVRLATFAELASLRRAAREEGITVPAMLRNLGTAIAASGKYQDVMDDADHACFASLARGARRRADRELEVWTPGDDRTASVAKAGP